MELHTDKLMYGAILLNCLSEFSHSLTTSASSGASISVIYWKKKSSSTRLNTHKKWTTSFSLSADHGRSVETKLAQQS